MNVLLYDANEERIQQFTAHFPRAVVVRTFEEAIDELPTRCWDQAWLGYNLDQELGVPSTSPNNGLKLVQWIVENRPKIRVVISHSFNTSGSSAMENQLYRAGYVSTRIPFGNLNWFVEEMRKQHG